MHADQQKKWYQTWKGLFWVLIGLSLFSAMNRTETPPRTETPDEVAAKKEERDSEDAAVYAKEYVKKSLKAPTTAKWPSTLDFAVAPKADKKGNKIKDVWEVSSYVDSQNSYGAMIRQKWYVKMKKINDSWVLQDIKFW